MKPTKDHWKDIYNKKTPNELSWFQKQPTKSLEFIEASGLNKDASIIDVGGGESTLVDYLLDEGYRNISVLDISSEALEYDKKRLGERASQIEWLETDVRTFQPKRMYKLWHDRAVFHFLTLEKDRQSYLQTLTKALSPGGTLIIASFTIGGPKKCSNLEVVQYDAESLSLFLGKSFELKETETESHQTPWNTEQNFIYCRFQRKNES